MSFYVETPKEKFFTQNSLWGNGFYVKYPIANRFYVENPKENFSYAQNPKVFAPQDPKRHQNT